MERHRIRKESKLYGDANLIFQLDLAPPHTANTATKRFTVKVVLVCLIDEPACLT